MIKIWNWIRNTFGQPATRRANHKYRVAIEVMYQAPAGRGRATIGTVELITNADNPADAQKTALEELHKGFTFTTTIHRIYV